MIIRLFQTTQVLFAPSQPSLRGRNLYVEIGGYEQQFQDCLSNTNSNSNSWKTLLAISIAIAIVGKSPQQQQYQQQQCQKRQQQQQFQYYCSCLQQSKPKYFHLARHVLRAQTHSIYDILKNRKCDLGQFYGNYFIAP